MPAAVECKAERCGARRGRHHRRIDSAVAAHTVAGELVGGFLGDEQHVTLGAESHLRGRGAACRGQRLGAARQRLQGAGDVAKACHVARACRVEHVDRGVVFGHADGLLAAGVHGGAQFQPSAAHCEGGYAVAERVDDEQKVPIATQGHGSLVAQARAGTLALRGQSGFECERPVARRRIDQQLVARHRVGAGEDPTGTIAVVIAVCRRRQAQAADGQGQPENFERIASCVFHRDAPLNV